MATTGNVQKIVLDTNNAFSLQDSPGGGRPPTHAEKAKVLLLSKNENSH